MVSKVSPAQRGTVIGAGIVTELRDVLHTVLDAAGPNAVATIPPGHFGKEDGKSMLCLLRDPSGKKHCSYAGMCREAAQGKRR